MLRKCLQFIWLLLTVPAWGQAAVISGQVNYNGFPVAGAPIRVCSVTSTNTPCTPTVPIYSDYALSHLITPNPTAADQYGNFTIYVPALAAPNLYLVQITPVQGTTWSYIYTGPYLNTSGGTITGNLAITGNLTVDENETVGGNLAVDGTLTGGLFNATTSPYYEVNGVQIACSNLSDCANLAKLNAANTFTGSPQTFTGIVGTSGTFSGALASATVTAGAINNVLYPLPGTAVKTAVDALPSTGGKIILAPGTYTSGLDSGTGLIKPNVKIYGSGMPALNCTLPCTPTALTGGTIIQGEVDVAGYSSSGSAIGFEMHDLGIDVGSAVVTAIYSGTPHNGLAMSNVGQVVGQPMTTGVAVDNVIVLGDQTSSPVHAFLFENLTGAHFAHLYSYLDGIGQVFKVVGSHIEDIHCAGHATACMYLKGDTYAPNGGNTVNGVVASYLATPGDTSGLNIDAGSANVDGENLSGLFFKDTTSGVNFLMDNANGLFVNNVNIDNFKMDDADIASGSRAAPCFFFFTTGTSTANRVNINNAICNNVLNGVLMTSNDTWQIISFNNFSGTNFTGDGMVLSGASVNVQNSVLTGIASGFYGYVAEGTGATTVNLLNVQAYNGAGIYSTVGSPNINTFGPFTPIMSDSVLVADGIVSSNAILGSNSVVTNFSISALSTPTPIPNTTANSGLLRLRDNTSGGAALFMIDPNGGAQLIGTSQITGISTSGAVTYSGGVWNVTLSSGTVPRTIAWTVYD